ncbi:MAG: hypothetical protein AMXMBFR37_18600 [Steroidobacteraceae bacterium]
MREEMRAACFLREREHDAGAETDREAEPGSARRAVAQHEVQREQRETRSRMRTREACRAAQGVRPIGKQRHIGESAAEGLEIPRTIHVGELLQQARHAIRHGERQHEIEQCTPVARERRESPAERPREQCPEADRAHQDTAATMHEAIGPERVAGKPAACGRIVEQPRDREIEMQAREQPHRREIRGQRPPRMPAQERRVHGRRVFFSVCSVRR